MGAKQELPGAALAAPPVPAVPAGLSVGSWQSHLKGLTPVPLHSHSQQEIVIPDPALLTTLHALTGFAVRFYGLLLCVL